MDYKFVASRHLKCLLNDAETKQKKDIYDYTKGHLNISRLRHPPEVLSQQRGWKTTPDSSLTSLVKSDNKTYVTKVPARQNDMKDLLYHFSVGTSGSVPYVQRKHNETKKLTFLGEGQSANSETLDPLSQYISDGVLIEELDNKEMCMPSPKYQTKDIDVSKYVHQDITDKHSETETSFKNFPQTLINNQCVDMDSNSFRHKFLPIQSSGITKQDQYRTFKAFESDIVRKKDALEKNVLSGSQAVKHHEDRLKQSLALLEVDGNGPNFHKLQIYSNVFEDLTEESSSFKIVLKDIKTVYDDYIGKLLDTQTSKRQVLQDQVNKMAVAGKSHPQDLHRAKTKVEELEVEGKWVLEENQRLRDALREETDLIALTPEIEPVPKKTSVYHDEPPAELAEELEHYKALILEKLDALNSLRSKLRDEHVPLTVCTHLEQCIKETEIEVQKLLKQNEYFEKSIADMEHDLKEAIVDADTSEKDAKRIWRKVNSVRAQPGDDEEDEGKWNWYIT